MSNYSKLVWGSLVGMAACFGMHRLYNKALSNRIKNSSLYTEAISILKTHEGAKYLLGEPIEDWSPSSVYSSIFFNGSFEFKTFVKGSKCKGVLYVTSFGEDEYSLQLDTIHLHLDTHKNKRLVIKEPGPRNAVIS